MVKVILFLGFMLFSISSFAVKYNCTFRNESEDKILKKVSFDTATTEIIGYQSEVQNIKMLCQSSNKQKKVFACEMLEFGDTGMYGEGILSVVSLGSNLLLYGRIDEKGYSIDCVRF
jgi:hypothetical protein